MKITVNGTGIETESASLADLLQELGHGDARVATAVNEDFVPTPARAGRMLENGDRVEIVAPRQGG